jgi:hypothetical protein
MTPLIPITLQSPGTLGLNTQSENRAQDPRYCTRALNCVIAETGLLESRQGTARTNTTAATGTPIMDVVFSYVEDDGTEHIVSAGGNKLWVGTTTLTDKTGALTVTSDDWQFQNYAGEVFGYNGVDAPVYWDGGAGNFLTIASKAGAAGVVASKTHLSAYGRSWVVDPTTPSLIKYSDLLSPHIFSGGSSGSIDMNTVWPYSNDTITCLAAHNNYLIIFCEKSIIVYSSANDVTNIALTEVIKDIGCVARDSVQNVGDDLFFLANDGVRSLSRTILQDNMPQMEISREIRDDLISEINGAVMGKVRSTYNEKQGFYVLAFVRTGDESSFQYVCDVRRSSENLYRWTTWLANAYALETSRAATDELYFGLAGGFIATYSGYNDTNTSTGNIDKTYPVIYRSAWTDAGESFLLIWKKVVFYIASLANISTVVTWSYDFKTTGEHSNTKSITGAGLSVYGTAVYGTDPYSGAYSANAYTYPIDGAGSIVRIGFQAVVDGGKFAFNRIVLFFKRGRMI